MQFQCENSQLEQCLRDTCDLILAQGGYIHPEMIIRQKGNELMLASGLPRSNQDRWIFVPLSCLVRIEDHTFDAVDGRIVITSSAQTCDEVALEMAQLVVDCYNLTDKVNYHLRSHHLFALEAHPAVLKHLYQARPWRKKFLPKNNEQKSRSLRCLESFFSTRTLSLHAQNATEGRYIMPIIDLLNHHILAPGYQLKFGENVEEGVTVMHSRPDPDSDECFACYGKTHEMFDTYITYSYLEAAAATEQLRSIPVDLPLGKLGTLRAYSVASAPYAGELPQPLQNLRFWIPPYAVSEGNAIDVQWLLIPGKNSPRALRRTLRTLIKTANPEATPGEILQATVRAETILIRTNKEYFQELRRLTDSAGAAETGEAALAALTDIQRLCEIQLTKLETYAEISKSLAVPAPGGNPEQE